MVKFKTSFLIIILVFVTAKIFAQPGIQMIKGEIEINLAEYKINECEIKIYVDSVKSNLDLTNIDFDKLPDYKIDSQNNFIYSLGTYIENASIIPKCDIYILVKVNLVCSYYFKLNGYLSKKYIINKLPEKKGNYFLSYDEFHNYCEYPVSCYILSPVKLKNN